MPSADCSLDCPSLCNISVKSMIWFSKHLLWQINFSTLCFCLLPVSLWADECRYSLQDSSKAKKSFLGFLVDHSDVWSAEHTNSEESLNSCSMCWLCNFRPSLGNVAFLGVVKGLMKVSEVNRHTCGNSTCDPFTGLQQVISSLFGYFEIVRGLLC